MPTITTSSLDGMTVAILVSDGFEQVEMTEPRKALEAAGARTQVVSPLDGSVRGWKHHDPADTFEVDVPLKMANPDDFDALLLPGGVVNPDALRIDEKAVAFVRAFVEAGKPIAAICHGPWTLIDAGGVKDRRMTSWPSLRADLRNAGARWSDQEVVVDHELVTSRKPDDLPAFNREMVRLFELAHEAALQHH
ncbi:glutamine amidotransferase [Variovorax paradoxus]|jgi:protease I|uniref:type 1 glutamine amidotransferase domain-containing protein n=1 Tax=Variovorax TaxID=34072 RepID=UPI0006E6AD16|nr:MULTISPECIES: type 1 glutamine amidotransferase domain-containing protein [unclassified Variovorax]KPU91299.1 glutamine amidotransferase [Variovorax paradoxus]KPV03312.1 glutamine amidotransferase [Variovorax paradoxus]KPV04623.1 glutamine amidotransferase [Variovorax paradoxus]KPV07666.1 glutamine amidotransferase [Variovorax paradoxus]KPV16861.1 glutamine amidotransferase [Variovorax paradoxus]